MANVSGEKTVIFDVSSCRVVLSTDSAVATLFAPSGELLAVIDVRPSWSERETALRLYDTSLASGFVWRDDALHRVGLWNPHTQAVAIDALPDTISFLLEREALPKTGLPVLVFPDQMTSQGDIFPLHSPGSFAALTRDLQAHRS